MPSIVSGRRLRPAVLLTAVLLAAVTAGCGSSDSGDDLGPLALAGGAMLITAVVTGVVILLRRRRAAS